MGNRICGHLSFVLLLVGFILSAHARAQVVTGVDYLGARHELFPSRAAFQVYQHTDVRALGFLWGTFGNDSDFLSRFLRQCPLRQLSKPRCFVRIHFLNGPCRRRNRCSAKGEIAPRLSVAQLNRAIERGDWRVMKRIRGRVSGIERMVTQFLGQAQFAVSTGLEDNYSTDAYKVILNELRIALPPEVLVGRNPENGHSRTLLGADFIELHGVLTPQTFGKTKALRIFSNDGNDLYLGEGPTPDGRVSLSDMYHTIRENRDSVDVVLYWRARWQGIASAKFVEPRRRTPVVNRADLFAINKLIRRNEHAH